MLSKYDGVITALGLMALLWSGFGFLQVIALIGLWTSIVLLLLASFVLLVMLVIPDSFVENDTDGKLQKAIDLIKNRSGVQLLVHWTVTLGLGYSLYAHDYIVTTYAYLSARLIVEIVSMSLATRLTQETEKARAAYEKDIADSRLNKK